MKDKTNLYAILAAVVVIVASIIILGLSLMTLLIAIIVGFLVYKKVKGDKTKPSENKEKVAEKSPTEIAIDSLLTINLALRKTIIPESLQSSFELIIDQLIAILPRVNSEALDGELAWVINRMATEYLPNKSVNPYLALDEATRNEENTIASVKEGLASMAKELDEVDKILSSRKSNEFNMKAKFLKQRFNM